MSNRLIACVCACWFSVIEVAFDEIRPEYRKNFSNYAPVINHLLELLDDPEADSLMKHFPRLKSKDKHLDQVGKGTSVITKSLQRNKVTSCHCRRSFGRRPAIAYSGSI